jgi:hypothetical protein
MRTPAKRWVRAAATGLLFLAAYVLYGANRDFAFESAPYLANPRARGVSIVGFTREPCRWSVVPLTPQSPHGDERQATRAHRIDLNNLTPGADVEVQVTSDGAPVPGGRLRFRTDPGPDVKTFELAVIGDSGAFPVRHREIWGYTPRPAAKYRPGVIVDRIALTRPRLLLHTGDVVYPFGARADYTRAFFRPFGPLLATAPIAAALGNHDLKSEGGLPFLDAVAHRGAPPLSGGRYASFNYGPLHVVILDSNEEDADMLPRQAAWLRADLSTATRPWKIAVCHVPLHFPEGAEAAGISEAQRRLSAELLRICQQGGVSVVFAGHRHWYERSVDDVGLTHVTTGGGGGELENPPPGERAAWAKAFHFVFAQVEGDAMVLRAITDEGAEIEGAAGVRVARRR